MSTASEKNLSKPIEKEVFCYPEFYKPFHAVFLSGNNQILRTFLSADQFLSSQIFAGFCSDQGGQTPPKID